MVEYYITVPKQAAAIKDSIFRIQNIHQYTYIKI